MAGLMANIGFAKPNPREQQRAQQREFRGIQRSLDRDRLQLDRQEKQLIAEIKNAAKLGQTEAAKKLAKQLAQVRNQRDKNAGAKAQVSAVAHKTQAMHSNAALGKAIGGAAKVMATSNQQLKLSDIQRTVVNFERESTAMDMKEELMNDAVDAVMESGDDEAEGQEIMDQVLDEIGIEIGSQLSDAPRTKLAHQRQEHTEVPEDAEIMKRLASLRS